MTWTRNAGACRGSYAYAIETGRPTGKGTETRQQPAVGTCQVCTQRFVLDELGLVPEHRRPEDGDR